MPTWTSFGWRHNPLSSEGEEEVLPPENEGDAFYIPDSDESDSENDNENVLPPQAENGVIVIPDSDDDEDGGLHPEDLENPRVMIAPQPLPAEEPTYLP